MSRRDQIKMTELEAAAFLAQERTVTCATAGPRGWPHLMPLWFVLRAPPAGESAPPAGESAPAAGESAPPAGESSPSAPSSATESPRSPPTPRLWAWTYGVSQKVRNLERDPRATLQVEAGEQYQELRGVMLECEVVVHRELETVKALGHEIFARYASPRGEPPAENLPAEVGVMVDKQAVKRVALEFVELRRASWDHRKLGGTY